MPPKVSAKGAKKVGKAKTHCLTLSNSHVITTTAKLGQNHHASQSFGQGSQNSRKG